MTIACPSLHLPFFCFPLTWHVVAVSIPSFKYGLMRKPRLITEAGCLLPLQLAVVTDFWECPFQHVAVRSAGGMRLSNELG